MEATDVPNGKPMVSERADSSGSGGLQESMWPLPRADRPRCTGNMGRGGAEEVPYSSVSEPSTSWLMRTPRAEQTPRLSVPVWTPRL